MLSKNPDATGYYQNSDNPKWLVSAVSQQTAATTQEVSASSEEQSARLLEVVSAAEKLSDLALHSDEVVSNFKI